MGTVFLFFPSLRQQQQRFFFRQRAKEDVWESAQQEEGLRGGSPVPIESDNQAGLGFPLHSDPFLSARSSR